VFEEYTRVYRAKHVKMTNKDLLPSGDKKLTNFNIDGENLSFVDTCI